ncbi:Glutaredoxin-like domain [Paramicrobacterium humi]|uniref:Glutaredoxin-like domain n=1 Tax=Paramicrobacterium humi TaxID=640635 RepID=A0A1H4JPT2_9MICO|nr:glutaredoxin family protein [Microbacterium humi]SEB47985.1 Glutaredoxin-like domain [Microbacterium humi]
MTRTVTIIGKPGCHLCDDARDAVNRVIAGLGPAASVTVDEKSILDDPALNERYWEQIPVILVDGEQHTFWRVDESRLAAALSTDA